MNNCYLCKAVKNKNNPYYIKRFLTGILILADNQQYEGYVLFISKLHKEELFELPFFIRIIYLLEMVAIAQALQYAFNPLKINYELLGNKERHIHFHLIPRRKTDKDSLMPIWKYPKIIKRLNYKKRNSLINQIKYFL